MQIEKFSLLKTSLIWGLCLLSLHVFWVGLVAFGFAQPLLDFVFKLHMLNSPFTVQAFDPILAMELLAFTFLIGCFYGAVFCLIRNRFFAAEK